MRPLISPNFPASSSIPSAPSKILLVVRVLGMQTFFLKLLLYILHTYVEEASQLSKSKYDCPLRQHVLVSKIVLLHNLTRLLALASFAFPRALTSQVSLMEQLTPTVYSNIPIRKKIIKKKKKEKKTPLRVLDSSASFRRVWFAISEFVSFLHLQPFSQILL